MAQIRIQELNNAVISRGIRIRPWIFLGPSLSNLETKPWESRAFSTPNELILSWDNGGLHNPYKDP